MTKEEFTKQLESHGHNLPVYWLRIELVDWLWGLMDPKLKEE